MSEVIETSLWGLLRFLVVLLQVLLAVVFYVLSCLKQTASEIPERCLQMDFCNYLKLFNVTLEE